MKMKEKIYGKKRIFDYYIFIDYSENLIGYLIIENKKIKDLMPKITKFNHYNEVKRKSAYLHSIKNVLDKENILDCLLKLKIKKTKDTLEIYSEILEFLKEHNNCLIFISVDNKQYSNFERLVNVFDGKNIKIIRESELKKGTSEHKMSLILDTLLNIERVKNA